MAYRLRLEKKTKSLKATDVCESPLSENSSGFNVLTRGDVHRLKSCGQIPAKYNNI